MLLQADQTASPRGLTDLAWALYIAALTTERKLKGTKYVGPRDGVLILPGRIIDNSRSCPCNDTIERGSRSVDGRPTLQERGPWLLQLPAIRAESRALTSHSRG